MKQWLIYKHTSMKSGKSYIGQTCTSIDRRWAQHTSEARKGSQLHFHRAITLYGENNWSHEVLAQGIDTLEEANALEKFYVKQHDTFENGYNLTYGGDSREYMKSPRVYTENCIWVHADLGVEVCTPMELATKYDIHNTQVTKVVREDTNNKVCKGWQLLVREGQELKKEFKDTSHTFYHDDYPLEECTAKELAKKFGLITSNVRKVVKGTRNHCKGWRLTENKVQVTPVSKLYRKVYVTDDNGTLVWVYNTASDASTDIGLNKKRVSSWLSKKKKHRHSNTYTYSYVSPEDAGTVHQEDMEKLEHKRLTDLDAKAFEAMYNKKEVK